MKILITENQLKNIILENYSIPQNEMLEIMKGYIQAALFTEEERINDEYGGEHDEIFKDDEHEDDELEKLIKISASMNQKGIEKFSKEDIEPDSMIKTYMDIKEFISIVGDRIDVAIEENGFEQIGHDLWLTRNRHGAGFFDRGYDDETEKLLIDASHKLGEVDLYINDNMKLSFSNENN